MTRLSARILKLTKVCLLHKVTKEMFQVGLVMSLALLVHVIVSSVLRSGHSFVITPISKDCAQRHSVKQGLQETLKTSRLCLRLCGT